MGVRNYLIEGVSGAGKTTVAEALERRGFHVIHGDRALAYLGDPETGEALAPPTPGSVADEPAWRHARWIWDLDKVRAVVADASHAQSFFCGGSRNHGRFIDQFDRVFVLEIDRDTLDRRLATRPDGEFGAKPEERRLVARLRATREDLPACAVSIDATAPVSQVVEAILSKCREGRLA